MKKVILATLYGSTAVMQSVTKFGPDILILLIDKKPNSRQNESLKLIENSLGKVLEIKTVKVKMYDVVEIAEKVTEIIDLQSDDTRIHVNITSGRKTQSIGLLLGSYTRANKIERIAYYPEEADEKPVNLPIIPFKLTHSQKMILEYLNEAKGDKKMKDLSDDLELSTAMIYRAIDELKGMDLVSTEEGIELTDAGKIARL
jgi:CRISPR locus-related DNA-binding protein